MCMWEVLHVGRLARLSVRRSWLCRMEVEQERHLLPPPKKSKLEESTSDGEKSNQLIERHWVKGVQSEESQEHKLLKVMQWNSLADGKFT